MVVSVKTCWVLALAIVATAGPAWPQLRFASEATQSRCKKYLKIPLPAEAGSYPAPKRWPDCKSYKSYSGLGRRADYDAARKCAWQERLAQLAGLEPRFSVASVFGGSAMLTVLYANGEGVKQNIPLAERFACEAEGAPAEISIRLEDLESRGKAGEKKSKFDFCNDITSGFMEGFCAAYGSELADEKRADQIQNLPTSMNNDQRRIFNQLVKLEQAYARAHADGEIDTSGTARAMYQVDAEDSLRDDFLAALELFEQKRSLPQASQADYRRADDQLNAVYLSTISEAEIHKKEYGAVQPEGIREAERAWLRYRDLFVAFAQSRYPQISKEGWLTLLTRDRTTVLDGSFCDMDAVEGKCAWKGDTWKPRPLP
jgi:uncharacterized protein YecT (DUF1311 family)